MRRGPHRRREPGAGRHAPRPAGPREDLVMSGLYAALLAASLLGAGPDRPRDEAFKMIDAYIVSNLQESLDLTDDQFVKVLPLVKRLQTDRRAVLQRRQQALMDLRRVLASGDATEGRVTELLGEVKA